MCGFVSFHTSSSNLDEYEDVLNEMLEAVKHRGPDGQGVRKISGQLLQGHVRLAIFDPIHGHQPMFSIDGRYSLVFNGAIYNFIELRNELRNRGVELTTQSDTEVLLQGLILFGEQMIQKIIGMFAFVFHDSKKNTWIAARDHFGIKPIYYTVTKNLIVFGSEKKSLEILKNDNQTLDFEALTDFLFLQFTFGSNTLNKQIKKIEPGTFVSGVGNEVTSIKRYWQPVFEDHELSEDQVLNTIENQISESVNINLRGDFEVGSYVSGGLDSSLIATLAENERKQNMKIFHGKFIEDTLFDESHYAEMVAKSKQLELFQIVITKDDFLREINDLMQILEEPNAGIGSFPQLMVSRLAASHVKVVLGGHGGDELFGGYTRYFLAYLEQALKGAINETQEEGKHLLLFSDLLPQLPTLKNYAPLMKSFWSEGLFDAMDQRYFKLLNRSSELIGLINSDITENLESEHTYERYRESFNSANSSSYINKMMNFDRVNILPSLLHVEDRVSMAASLESRVPFLDPRLVETLYSISPTIKFKKGESKYLLKKIASKHLPNQIIDRKDKMGFPVPLNIWMKDTSFQKTMCDHIYSVPELWGENIKKNSIKMEELQPRVIWGMLSLSIWWRDVYKK
jgi:asparagine synthase (glutamine-hydrolysing)